MSGHDLEDDRPRRRDRAGIATGLLIGAGLGALAGTAVTWGGLILAAVGAVVGAVAGKVIALHISADDWDPRFNRRPYVGANSPDES